VAQKSSRGAIADQSSDLDDDNASLD